jgi:NAD+ synthase (glutamine-hydrolysing)
LARENLQARIRGAILMALSNRYGRLLLATGNKSEMSVGYATLYGDLAGGFAALKDVPKTLVYRLSRWRNARPAPGGRGRSAAIPARVLSRAPTAELRPNQKDSDSLPPYSVLDPILKAYVEDEKSPEAIARSGFRELTVRKVVEMVERSEYKRRQAPPGVKIQPRAFGKDRRMPITHGFNGAASKRPRGK